MLIDLTEEETTLFKKFVNLFCNIGTYVHEGVAITVQWNGGADECEAARKLSKFIDECYWPPYLDMLQSVVDQIDGNNNIEKSKAESESESESKSESEFVFRIKQSDFNDPADFEGGVKDMQLLIKFLCNANPNYYLLGGVLDKQLNEQLKEE